jgi:hypothetical protein
MSTSHLVLPAPLSQPKFFIKIKGNTLIKPSGIDNNPLAVESQPFNKMAITNQRKFYIKLSGRRFVKPTGIVSKKEVTPEHTSKAKVVGGSPNSVPTFLKRADLSEKDGGDDDEPVVSSLLPIVDLLLVYSDPYRFQSLWCPQCFSCLQFPYCRQPPSWPQSHSHC